MAVTIGCGSSSICLLFDICRVEIEYIYVGFFFVCVGMFVDEAADEMAAETAAAIPAAKRDSIVGVGNFCCCTGCGRMTD